MIRTDVVGRLDRLKRLLEENDGSWVRQVLSNALARGFDHGRQSALHADSAERKKFVEWYEMEDDYDGEDIDYQPPIPAPLSGEWAGESIPELLNLLNLTVGYARTGDDEMLDAYEDRYRLGFIGGFMMIARDGRNAFREMFVVPLRRPRLPLSDPVAWWVCLDCVEYFEMGEMEEEARQRVSDAEDRHFGYLELNYGRNGLLEIDEFSKASCDFCDSNLAGQRFSSRFTLRRSSNYATPMEKNRLMKKAIEKARRSE